MAANPVQPDDAARCHQLVAKLCDDRLTPAEAAELEALVRGSDELCRHYILTVSLQADLHMQAVMLSRDVPKANLEWRRPGAADGGLGQEVVYGLSFDPNAVPASEEPPTTRLSPTIANVERMPIARRRWFERPSLWAAAAVVLIGAFMAGRIVRDGHGPGAVPIPAVAIRGAQDTLASIDLSLNPVWRDAGAPLPGTRLPIGPIELRSGIARLTLANGVDIVLEGPASVRRIDRGQLVMDAGRVTVRAAHEVKGYTVVTPSASVVDLGTEFGVAVAPRADAGEGGTQTVVFDGSVHVAGRSPAAEGATLVLAKGQACSVMPGADPVAVTPEQAGSFCRPDDVEQRRRRIEQDLRIVGRPGVLAAYLFDEDRGGGRLPGTLPWRSASEPNKVRIDADGEVHPLLVTDLSAAFLDLDTSPTGRLATKGLVRADGSVGADGRSVYVSWTARAIKWAPDQFGGMSLSIGDRSEADEAIFVGQPFQQSRFSAKARDGAGTHAGRVFNIDVDPTRPGVQPMAVDGREHRFVVRVDFTASIGGQIKVYLDPAGTAEPADPGLSLSLPRLQFNRLRMASGTGCTWAFSNVLVGETYPSVVPEPGK